MPITVATINVNGLRAAVRKGFTDWLDTWRPDVVTLQEVRCPADLVADLLPGWEVVHESADQAGRAGVAIAAREPITVGPGLGVDRFVGSGRWIEGTVAGGALTVVSAYVHTGDADDADRMDEKLAFLAAATERLDKLASGGDPVLLTGDLNVAHRQVDLKNWKGNRGKAGYLPEEQAYLDRWIDTGWIDIGRQFGGDGPGPYSWWSYRGRAYDNDAGWRIDYQFASPELAPLATDCFVERSAAYADRWSDHAPVVATYDLSPTTH